MRLIPKLSLMQQTALGLGTGALATLCWCFQVFFQPKTHASHLSTFMTVAVVILGSFVASICVMYDLRTGIESGRWSDTEIEHFRSVFRTPLLSGVSVATSLGAVFFLLFSIPSHSHRANGVGYGLLFIAQILQQFANAAAPPRRAKTGERIDWRSASRITSEHWGSR